MASERKPRSKLREEVAALKRQRTLDAATDLFYEKGYTNTTLDDVANQLGVTKPFIYTNFGSKPDLLAEICRIGVSSALDEVERVLAQGEPNACTLQRFIPRYVDAVLRRQKNIAVNIREEKNLLPEHATDLAELRRAFMARIELLLTKSSAAAGHTLTDPQVTAFAVVGAVSWTTFWYNPKGALSAEDLSGKLADIVLNLVKDAAPVA
jgi:AcrR family transcriptional regulator